MQVSAPLQWVLEQRRVSGASATAASVGRLVLAACAIGFIASLAIAGVFRLGYAYPLSSNDAASLEEVQRIVNGQPLYVAPTLQHVPFIYGPVYYFLSALLTFPLGLSYLPLRLVSLLASLGTLALIGYLVWRETQRPLAALAASGLLAAAAPLSGTFDLAHIDALFVFLIVASIVVARVRSDVPSLAAGGVLLGLAGLTKVPIGVAPIAVALLVYLAITVRLRSTAFAVGLLGSAAIILLLLRLQSGPWPIWYMLDLPSKHVINNHGDGLPYFWFRDILPRFTLPLLIGPVFLLMRLASGDRAPALFYTLVVGSLVTVGWAARSNSGSAANVLLPTHVAIALLLGLGLDGVLRIFSSATARISGVSAYVLGVCVLQFALLAYNPRALVPYRSEGWAAQRLTDTLSGLDGGLFAAGLDGYVRGSDKGEQPHVGAILELQGSFGGKGTAEGTQWRTDFAQALRERRFAHVVVNEDCCGIVQELQNNGYISSGPLFAPDDEFWLWTDGSTPGHMEVFVPAEQAQAAAVH
jgi:4-amino-4-deoxy-L-arabinose transferase-like glycosyltransferase